MRKKTVALVLMFVIMAGSIYATAAPVTVNPGEPVYLEDYLESLAGTSMVIGDPVPGTGGGGGYD